MLAVLGGIWLAQEAIRRSDRRVALLAGAAFGVGAVVRIDGWVIGVAIAVAVATDAVFSDDGERLVTRQIWTGFFGVALIGVLDLFVFSLPYLQFHRSQIMLLLVASLGAWVLASPIFSRLWRSIGLWMAAHERGGHLFVAGVLGAFALFVFAIRPWMFPSYGGSYGLPGMEAREGLLTGTGRDYVEFSAWWQVWI